jgi:CRISPR-associated protein Cas1
MAVVETLETLIVEEFGACVGKHSQRLRVTVKGQARADTPLITLRQVIVKSRGVSVSSDAVMACAERGIPIHFVSGVGLSAGAALYTAALTGTVRTRRCQLVAYDDRRGAVLAAAFARAKLANQAGLLKYLARNRKQTGPQVSADLRAAAREVNDHLIELDDLIARVLGPEPPAGCDAAAGSMARAGGVASPVGIDQWRSALLSIEGRAAKRYWEGVGLVVPDDLAWPGRRGRGARDPLNSALNYGYAILLRQVEHAVVCAGLDPFAGFIHADRPGKPSLTLDLIEEFRQAVVDRAILGMVGNRAALTVLDNGFLDDATRRELAAKVIARIEESGERYEGRRHSLREIIQMQARHIATFVRGDNPSYQGFVAKW